MPIQRAAFKSVRKDKKRHQRNLRIISELRTAEKKFVSCLSAKKPKEAGEALALLISKIGKAASKGILHRNTASRKISRLKIGLNKLEKSTAGA